MNIIELFLYTLPGILTAIIFHELAHGYVAYKLGDNTPKTVGRLTLNPIKHIDPMGLLCMFIFKFGWAKPIPVNSSNFKNRKLSMCLVALAGPAANFILALIALIVSNKVGTYNDIFDEILMVIFFYNVYIGVFNLMPFPPLDGSKILASFLPQNIEYYIYKNEQNLSLILMLLIFTGVIGKITSPLISIVVTNMYKIANIF